jgi:hypothetical protein
MITAYPHRLLALVAALAMLVVHAGRARADSSVDTLIKQLENDDSEKVRLAAALNLAKLGDAKAILPLAKAVGNDGDKNVRGASAVGLGKLVTAATKASYKSLAIAALRKAAAGDESDFVKQQAQKALDAITGGSGSTTTTPPPVAAGGGIYVNIGPMSSKTGSANDPKLRALMVSTATKTMGRAASQMATSWPGGGPPSKAQLAAKNMDGFYVDGTLNTLTVKESGSTSTVSCKISMLLASYPDKSVFGFLNGGASVQASTSPKEEALAQEDCVSAVVEDLIAKKIVPTICTKASCP